MKVEIVHDQRRLHAVAGLLSEVFRAPPGHEPVSPELLRAVAHSGGAVHVASSPTGELLGASVAIFGPPRSQSVYSFIAAAKQSDRGVGLTIKQAQRAWALSQGATTMRWTFDPLVGRNARFNLVKLGARAVEYAVDFYGPMSDAVNGIGPSDRFTAEWDLVSPNTTDPPGPVAFDDGVAPDGGPLTAHGAAGTAGVMWVRVPEDVVALRQSDPAQAAAWRLAVRDALMSAFDAGYVAVGMTRDGWYRLEPR
jgi:predicted GNAT superfamily acetyltransferase